MLVLLPLLAQLPTPSLQQLEQQQVITPAERRRLERGSLRAAPTPALQRLCQLDDGAVSRQECTAAVAPNPLQVPVSALLGGLDGSFSLQQVLRVTPRPAPLGGNGNQALLFPLIGSAFTSSGFGWRQHPVLGGLMLHAGRDLAAPQGTPVVAALGGTVRSAGLAGGYGVAIELDHQEPQRQRTLYGHLSELYVEPGDAVQQGEVIGRVGSTGLSTGPHLHFELRRPQAGGWVAVDPGRLLPDGMEVDPAGAVAALLNQMLRGLER